MRDKVLTMDAFHELYAYAMWKATLVDSEIDNMVT